MLGKSVPITDDDEKSMIKHRWSPTPPRWGSRVTLIHSIPEVAKIPSIGMLPVRNVGGRYRPVW